MIILDKIGPVLIAIFYLSHHRPMYFFFNTNNSKVRIINVHLEKIGVCNDL